MSLYSAKSFNSRKTFDMWNNDTITDGRSQLLTWLSPLSPGLRHWEIQERRVNDVGEWLLETEEFRRWHASSEGGASENAVLFCYGDPGVGKTFISSLVVDRLCHQTSEQNTTASCFYLDFATRKEQSATNVLGSLLKQMIGGMERIPKGILLAFQQHRTAIGGRRPQLSNIVKMLQLITSSRRTFMCIDALDECSGVQRVKLLDSLKQILERSPDTRIFVTGRPHIRAEIEKRLAGHVTSVSVSLTRNDITRYLRTKLHEDETPDAMDESLEADILREIPESVSEMFQLASLNIAAILREPTTYQRRERLRKMTDGLGWGDDHGTAATIERIKAQDGGKSELGMAALMWVSHAERPLRADELCHALAVELGSKSFNTSKVPSISTLVCCSQGLITVDKETSIVRLIHLTVKEYLSARPDIFGGPHSTMAEICLTYLNSQEVKALSNDPYAITHDKPFLGYCSVYWGVHAKRELSSYARSLALELFREYDSHISSNLLLDQVEPLDHWDYSSDFGSDLGSDYFYDDSFPFNGLHCASFFGLVEVVATLIEMECYDVNERDARGSTPLVWAARNGHGEVVKVLLGRREICPNQSDCSGVTPLAYAAWNGNEDVVKMLLEHREVCPDEQDPSGKTPLSYAAWKGHAGVVKILLGQKGVNPQMALPYAASGGNEDAVKILLEREGVSPDRPSNSGRTPLIYAAWGGHAGVVKALLEREEVNPDRPEMYCRTPLSYAAQHGHEGVVNILLERADVNPDKPDDCGQTPLSYAAQNGHGEVVKVLLGVEKVSPDKPDDRGHTPLSFAAQNGHEGVVIILLTREEVNPDKLDTFDRTPLSCAAERGHEGVVKILLQREEVNPNQPDDMGRTPLSYAVQWGNPEVVKILLGREEVDPYMPDEDGQTPLMHAARDGNKKMMALLMAHGEAIPPP